MEKGEGESGTGAARAGEGNHTGRRVWGVGEPLATTATAPLLTPRILSPYTQGPKGELELKYPDLVEIKKVRLKTGNAR